MSVVAATLEEASRTAKSASPELRGRAAAIILDSVMTMMLGHAAPEIRKIVAQQPISDMASILSVPTGRADIERAAYANAMALCWYELDPGFRHAGCHVPLHTLPALLAVAEAGRLSVGDVITRFIYCYEVVAQIAMTWDTRPSGIHSHAIFSHLGAVVAVAAAAGENNAFIAHALDLASSAVNVGNGWEISEGGELRNLWPAMAAANARPLYWAAKAGVTTASGRLEKSFDRLFRRRENRELQLRFDGAALSQNYGKLHSACRHVHTTVSATLALRKRMTDADARSIDRIEVRAYPEAAALSATQTKNLLNAQFSLPVSVAIALAADRFDPECVAGMRSDPAVAALAQRVTIHTAPERAYPADRAASVKVSFADGRHVSETVEIAAGDPAAGWGDDAFLEKKAELVAAAFPPPMRDQFLRTMSGLRAALRDEEKPLAVAFRELRP